MRGVKRFGRLQIGLGLRHQKAIGLVLQGKQEIALLYLVIFGNVDLGDPAGHGRGDLRDRCGQRRILRQQILIHPRHMRPSEIDGRADDDNGDEGDKLCLCTQHGLPPEQED
nr:hypothetical protein [Marinicella sp. W31]MDC2879656.1 hypothetical protein [Marinicella sp. W31]